MAKPARNKNNAKLTYYKDSYGRNHRYASKLEASYALHLDRKLSKGEIKAWTPHPFKLPLVVNGKDCGTYTPDFQVIGLDDAEWIVDTKGRITREWPFRKKIILACHPGIDLRVVFPNQFKND